MLDWGGLTGGLTDLTASSLAGSTSWTGGGGGGAVIKSVVLIGMMRRIVVLGSVGTLEAGVAASDGPGSVYRDQVGPSSRNEDTGLTRNSGRLDPDQKMDRWMMKRW